MPLPFTSKGKKSSSDDDPGILPIADLLLLRQQPKGPKLQQALKLFRGEDSTTIFNEMTEFLQRETDAEEVHFLRMRGNISEEFELIKSSQLQKDVHSNKKYYGMSEAMYKRLPVLLEKGFTTSWKTIFRKQPEFLIIIPVTVVAGKIVFVMGTALLGYYGPLPTILEEEKTWHTLLDYLQLTLPLLINVKKAEESEEKCQRLVDVLESLARSERDIHDINNCLIAMATEISKFIQANYVEVLMVQQEIIEDKKLHKCCNIGTPTVQPKCPDKACHEQEDLQISPTTNCIGYVATSGKPLRANEPTDLVQYGLPSNSIHSVGGCLVNNILVIPVSDHTGEAPVIIELSQKAGGFSPQDEEQCMLFAHRAATLISSSILLDYKRKSIRRHGIRNEVLANIGEVSHVKVKQMLDLKFQYSSSFRKRLMDFRFSMRIFPDHQSPGVVLYMFIDLGFVQRWQMRKSTLIRFILSMQQGYRDIPYHNWKHACCVTHFAYLLLKKLQLAKLGYLTELEALTLFISCLAHDIDHRGRNNHFNLCTKSELYNLYKQEDSIMERHHIAVALSVLNSEDCNILASLTDLEYREFLEMIQWNILATDLAKYMHNRFEYFYTLSHFDPSNRQHRKHLSAIIMTTADLCDNIKTWDTNLPTVKSIFHEFFAQGDDEIALGLKPMEMMDRRMGFKIPDIEIQFIHHIVRPAYHALADLLPQTKVCLHTLDYFEDLWLISTHVFDEHADIEDALQILDMKELKEESLKKRSAPQLQNVLEKHGIPALSIAHIGIKAGSRTSMSTLDIELSGPISTEENQDTGLISTNRRRSSIPLPPPIIREKLTCCEMTRNWLCCYLCRHRGLVVARAVRKFQLEEEYLDDRAIEYERRMSGDNDNQDSKPERSSKSRGRLDSIFVPKP